MINVVYASKTGYTKHYAELLADALDTVALDIKNSKKQLKPTDKVIFLGNVFASKISKLSKAVAAHNVVAVCAVGITEPCDENYENIKKNNSELGARKLFILQGGFQMEKLGFMSKKMMGMMLKSTEEKAEKTQQDLNFINAMKKGVDFVSIENLKPILDAVPTL